MRPPDSDELRRRLGRIAWLLDNSIPLPGTRFRFGLDAILGLIPGLGDAIGVVLSSYIVREAARAGVPRVVLAHMAWNVAVEGVIGLIPFAGDIFDAAWKANQRNVALLERHLDQPQRAKRASGLFVTGLIAALVLLIAATGTAAYFIVRAIAGAFSG